MTDWLPQNPEINTSVVPCARPRLSGALFGVAVVLFEVEARVEAQYCLRGVPKNTDAPGG